jgi:hypothetical protein
MEAKVLSPVEQENIDGTQDDFLTALLADKQNIRVSDCMETELKQYFYLVLHLKLRSKHYIKVILYAMLLR